MNCWAARLRSSFRCKRSHCATPTPPAPPNWCTDMSMKGTSGTSRISISNFWSRMPRPIRALQTVADDGEMLPSLDKLAKQIDAGAHAFSSTNPQAVAAWASGDYEKAVSLDPGFGAAWSSWVQARVPERRRRPNNRPSISRRDALAQSSFNRRSTARNWNSCRPRLRQDAPAQDRALKALAQLMPHDLALLRQLATRETNARHFSEAARYYEAILQEAPDDIEIWNQLGYAQAFAGDLESAQKSFERYGRDPAHAANSLDSLGEAAFVNGKFAAAEKSFLDAHAKSSALLGGARPAQGGLCPLAARRPAWRRQGVLSISDLPHRAERCSRPVAAGRLGIFRRADTDAAMARLSSVSGPAANIAAAQLALWKDPSRLPQRSRCAQAGL